MTGERLQEFESLSHDFNTRGAHSSELVEKSLALGDFYEEHDDMLRAKLMRLAARSIALDTSWTYRWTTARAYRAYQFTLSAYKRRRPDAVVVKENLFVGGSVRWSWNMYFLHTAYEPGRPWRRVTQVGTQLEIDDDVKSLLEAETHAFLDALSLSKAKRPAPLGFFVGQGRTVGTDGL